MSWIRLDTSFYTHRKTRLLKAKIGQAAYWVMPRLWCHCAENQTDGDFTTYAVEELARIADFAGEPSLLLSSLQSVGYMDGSKLHEWMEHNGHALAMFKDRARKAAAAKWAKFYAEQSSTLRTEETNGAYQHTKRVTYNTVRNKRNVASIASSNAPSSASSRRNMA